MEETYYSLQSYLILNVRSLVLLGLVLGKKDSSFGVWYLKRRQSVGHHVQFVNRYLNSLIPSHAPSRYRKQLINLLLPPSFNQKY